MPSTQAYRQPSIPSFPVSVPGKSSYYPPPIQTTPYGRMATSPPEPSSSLNSSAVPSLTSGSYAGSSNSEYDSSRSGTSSVDLVEMLNDRLSNAVDPLPLDRSLARQAQTSGELNAKHRELLELQALAQRRLKSTRANFADGMNAAKEVKRDLDWTQKRVTALKSKAEQKYPTQYRTASQQYPASYDY